MCDDYKIIIVDEPIDPNKVFDAKQQKKIDKFLEYLYMNPDERKARKRSEDRNKTIDKILKDL